MQFDQVNLRLFRGLPKLDGSSNPNRVARSSKASLIVSRCLAVGA